MKEGFSGSWSKYNSSSFTTYTSNSRTTKSPSKLSSISVFCLLFSHYWGWWYSLIRKIVLQQCRKHRPPLLNWEMDWEALPPRQSRKRRESGKFKEEEEEAATLTDIQGNVEARSHMRRALGSLEGKDGCASEFYECW